MTRKKVEQAGLRFEVLVPCLVGGVHPLRVSLRPDGSLLSVSSSCTEHKVSETEIAVLRSLKEDTAVDHTCAKYVELIQKAAASSDRVSIDFDRMRKFFKEEGCEQICDISESAMRSVLRLVQSRGVDKRTDRLPHKVYHRRTRANALSGARWYDGLVAVAVDKDKMRQYLKTNGYWDDPKDFPEDLPKTVGSSECGKFRFRPVVMPKKEVDDTGKVIRTHGMRVVLVASRVPYATWRNEMRGRPFGHEVVVATRKGPWAWSIDESAFRTYATSGYSNALSGPACNKHYKNRTAHLYKTPHIKAVRTMMFDAIKATDDHYQSNMLARILKR